MPISNIRIGIVGCGSVARLHANALKKIKQADIKAVVDINEERAKKFANRFNIKSYYKSLKDMLMQEKIEAVSILTPPQTHHKLAIEAMKAGKHVLVEKPLCITLKEVEEMIKVSEKNNVILFPIEQFLFTPAMQEVTKLISSEKAGEVINIYTYASISPLVAQLKGNILPKWIYTLPGGIYGEEISHSLYTTLKILDENIDKIHASCVGKRDSNVLPFSELRILLEGKNKSARIIMTTRTKAGHTLLTMVINCEKCTIIVDPPLSLSLLRDYTLPRINQATFFTKSFFSNIFNNIIGAITSKIYEGCSWEAANRAFIKSIIENRDPPITKEEAREWVRITELIWKTLSLIK